MMTVEELQKYAKDTLDEVKTQLVADNDFFPQIYMVKGDTLSLFAFDPDWMNSGLAKSALFGAVKRMAKETQAEAVICVTDGWGIKHSSEQEKRLREDEDYRAEYQRIADEEGLPEAAAAGFGELWEAIIVTVQSPLYQILMTQNYQRKGKDDKTFSHWGEFKGLNTNIGKLKGRILFFDEA